MAACRSRRALTAGSEKKAVEEAGGGPLPTEGAEGPMAWLCRFRLDMRRGSIGHRGGPSSQTATRERRSGQSWRGVDPTRW